LRKGEYTIAAPRYKVEEFGPWDYAVCLHRGDRPNIFEFWLTGVRERLPRVPVPLTSDYPDGSLDLQSVFDSTYDSGIYPRFLDYTEEPAIPLSADDAEWANALLIKADLRKPHAERDGV